MGAKPSTVTPPITVRIYEQETSQYVESIRVSAEMTIAEAKEKRVQEANLVIGRFPGGFLRHEWRMLGSSVNQHVTAAGGLLKEDATCLETFQKKDSQKTEENPLCLDGVGMASEEQPVIIESIVLGRLPIKTRPATFGRERCWPQLRQLAVHAF